jgi:hypothetical protein
VTRKEGFGIACMFKAVWEQAKLHVTSKLTNHLVGHTYPSQIHNYAERQFRRIAARFNAGNRIQLKCIYIGDKQERTTNYVYRK